MKEHPILFTEPMVQALLAGTKTQTRRLVKWRGLEPGLNLQFSGLQAQRSGSNWVLAAPTRTSWEYRSVPMPCPYGEPGDRLWVRENGWERPERTPKMMRDGADTWAPYYYDADGINEREAADFKAWGFKRRPSIHMPRAASRILLDLTGVRVERLQSISDEDCRAEGCAGGHGSIPGYQYNATPREHYISVWARINGAESWAANPWVWVLEFRRVQP